MVIVLIFNKYLNKRFILESWNLPRLWFDIYKLNFVKKSLIAKSSLFSNLLSYINRYELFIIFSISLFIPESWSLKISCIMLFICSINLSLSLSFISFNSILKTSFMFFIIFLLLLMFSFSEFSWLILISLSWFISSLKMTLILIFLTKKYIWFLYISSIDSLFDNRLIISSFFFFFSCFKLINCFFISFISFSFFLIFSSKDNISSFNIFFLFLFLCFFIDENSIKEFCLLLYVLCFSKLFFLILYFSDLWDFVWLGISSIIFGKESLKLEEEIVFLFFIFE